MYEMLNAFQEFFENPAFRADGLKIYPTLVIRGTGMFCFSLELCFFKTVRISSTWKSYQTCSNFIFRVI